MEFEEMKKIWDTQNNEPMYAINEEALKKGIRRKRNKASWASNFTEFSLVAIALITGVPLIIKHINDQNFYSMIPAIMLLLTAVYVLVSRAERKKRENQYDQSIIGDIDQAISNVDFEVRRAKTFIWWYITPIAIAVFFKMAVNDDPIWKWFVIPVAFVFSYIVVQFGLHKAQLPRKRYLERLRKKLAEEFEVE